MIISKKKFVSWLLVLGTGATALVVSSRAFDWPLGGPKPVKTTVPIVVNEAPVARETRLTSSFAPVVKRVAPSVVNVFTTKTVRNQSPEMMPFFDDPFFRRFFGEPFGGEQPRRQPRKFKERSLGSGVIVSKDGYILTNNHVVDGADEVKVSLAKDKKEYTAKIAGRDPKTDIAILKIDARDLPFVTFADSDKIEVGDVVLALGNPFGIGQTVTMGIVSAVGRGGMHIEDYEDFIQTDAAINPGNSGGPLIDAEGRLIGINTAILSRSGGNQGIGFAIPANLARNVMENLINNGHVVRSYLGVHIQDVTPALAEEFNLKSASGVVVTDVAPKSPAEKGGFKSGDVITEFNGKPVQDSRHLKLTVAQTAPGTTVSVKVLRDSKPRTIEVAVNELPGDEIAGSSHHLKKGDEEGASSDSLNGVAVADLDSATRRQLHLPANVKGALVTEVAPDSAAYEAGLRSGDVIQEINRKPVTNSEDAVRLTDGLKDKKMLLHVWSQGGSRFVVVDESKTNAG